MLKNHWYAVEFGSAVDLTPVAARVFGQDLVLYRDCLGAMVCHSDTCVHCGSSLATGSVVGDRLRCSGCAREYDLDGVCTRLPEADHDVAIPLNARLDSYPSVEQYGFVFVFLGDLPGNRRPPGPRLPVLDVMPYAQAHGHRVVSGETAWAANYERVIEASVDIERVQALYGGDDEPADAGMYEESSRRFYALEETHVGLWTTGVVGSVALSTPTATGLRRFSASKTPADTTSRVGVFFPNLTFVETPVVGGSMTIVTAVVPVDRQHCVSKWTMLRTSAMSSIGDSSARRRMKRFAEVERRLLEAGETGPMAVSRRRSG